MAILQSLSESDSGSFWSLQRRITSVGRASDNDIEIACDVLGEHHATVVLEGSHFVVRPVDRSSSVTVNDKKVRRKRVLEDGDIIGLADYCLRFSLTSSPDSRVGDGDHGFEPDDQRRLHGLRSMHRFSLQLLRTQDLGELLEDMLDSVIELSGADRGFLVLMEGEEFSVHVARNVDAESLSGDGKYLSDSVVQRVIDTCEPLIISDARSDDEFRDARSVIDLQLCSVLCVPLLNRGQLLGVVYVGNDRISDLFDEVHLELLEIFASQLALLIANAILVNDIREDNRQLQAQLRERRFGSLIGASSAMEPVFHTVERVAPTTITVLITGETGTGKELVAREVHRHSTRASGPFVTLNCGAIPENLLESELFGHEKGAFTGATAQRDGRFHMAHKGTIFLDEIGEMPLQLQVKLLRVLQERKITRVGSNRSQAVDIRIVAATNRNLEQRIADGEFREDLYFRLNVVEISIPPLRDRGEDIILIARFLIEQICDELNLSTKRLSAGAIRAMRKYAWPGNVRQLQNRLKKALVLATGSSLTAPDLDLEDEKLPDLMPLSDAKEEFAMEYILKALEQNGGNRTQTARDLGVDPRTIFRYLKKTPS